MEITLLRLIDRNEYLNNISDVGDKLELLFRKPAASGTKHYIIRCDPEVREMIHKHYDQVKLEWGVCLVRDRYMVTSCYHCQRFGHTSSKCAAKAKGEESCCAK